MNITLNKTVTDTWFLFQQFWQIILIYNSFFSLLHSLKTNIGVFKGNCGAIQKTLNQKINQKKKLHVSLSVTSTPTCYNLIVNLHTEYTHHVIPLDMITFRADIVSSFTFSKQISSKRNRNKNDTRSIYVIVQLISN